MTPLLENKELSESAALSLLPWEYDFLSEEAVDELENDGLGEGCADGSVFVAPDE